jgi:PST family polysaccharide transporter
MVRLSIFFLGGLGLLFGLILFLGAPLLVHVILGDAFRESIPALRVFSVWIPLIALSTVLIFQLLLPNQMDRQFNLVLLTGGLLGLGCALLLAPAFQAVGIAWSIVVAQLYTLIAFSVVLARAGLNPFAFSPKTEVVAVSG